MILLDLDLHPNYSEIADYFLPAEREDTLKERIVGSGRF